MCQYFLNLALQKFVTNPNVLDYRNELKINDLLINLHIPPLAYVFYQNNLLWFKLFISLVFLLDLTNQNYSYFFQAL